MKNGKPNKEWFNIREWLLKIQDCGRLKKNCDYFWIGQSYDVRKRFKEVMSKGGISHLPKVYDFFRLEYGSVPSLIRAILHDDIDYVMEYIGYDPSTDEIVPSKWHSTRNVLIKSIKNQKGYKRMNQLEQWLFDHAKEMKQASPKVFNYFNLGPVTSSTNVDLDPDKKRIPRGDRDINARSLWGRGDTNRDIFDHIGDLTQHDIDEISRYLGFPDGASTIHTTPPPLAPPPASIDYWEDDGTPLLDGLIHDTPVSPLPYDEDFGDFDEEMIDQIVNSLATDDEEDDIGSWGDDMMITDAYGGDDDEELIDKIIERIHSGDGDGDGDIDLVHSDAFMGINFGFGSGNGNGNGNGRYRGRRIRPNRGQPRKGLFGGVNFGTTSGDGDFDEDLYEAIVEGVEDFEDVQEDSLDFDDQLVDNIIKEMTNEVMGEDDDNLLVGTLDDDYMPEDNDVEEFPFELYDQKLDQYVDDDLPHEMSDHQFDEYIQEEIDADPELYNNL
jgi:hypothetical protein